MNDLDNDSIGSISRGCVGGRLIDRIGAVDHHPERSAVGTAAGERSCHGGARGRLPAVDGIGDISIKHG